MAKIEKVAEILVHYSHVERENSSFTTTVIYNLTPGKPFGSLMRITPSFSE